MQVKSKIYGTFGLRLQKLYTTYMVVTISLAFATGHKTGKERTGISVFFNPRRACAARVTVCHSVRIPTIFFYSDEAQQRRQSLERESRDEILVKMGELEAQKKVLIALQAGEPSEELKSEYRKLKNILATSNTALNNLATNTENYRQRCLISRIKAKANESFDVTECDRYANSSSSAYESVESSTELFACVRDLDFQVNAFEQSREALNQTAQAIEQQIEALQQRLSTTDVKFSHLAREAQHAADSQDILDSQWLSFQFDSKRYKSSSSTSYSRTTSHFAASARGSYGLFSFSASYSSSRSRSDYSFQAAMNSAETVVGGELLRVTVQRPWFRPSLFKSNQFQIRVGLKCHYLVFVLFSCVLFHRV